MDVLRPQLIYIDGRCYRKNHTPEEQEVGPYVEESEYLETGIPSPLLFSPFSVNEINLSSSLNEQPKDLFQRRPSLTSLAMTRRMWKKQKMDFS